MATQFEVQYVDGFGAWRRWSTKATLERAGRSLERYVERYVACMRAAGLELEPRVRIVERAAGR